MISFVASAVALLIGIIVYSDIQDDLVGTFEVFPEVTIPEVNQNLGQNSASGNQPIPADTTNLASVYSGLNNTDFVTEVEVPISGVILPPFIEPEWNLITGQYHSSLPCDSQVTYTEAPDYLQFSTLTDVDNVLCGQAIYQSFDKNTINGKTLTLEWQGLFSGTFGTTTETFVYLVDGQYNSTNVIPTSCGFNCFIPPAQIIQTIFVAPDHAPSGFALRNDSGTINTTGATGDYVTIVVAQEDKWGSAGFGTNIYSIDIDGLAYYDLGTDFTNTFVSPASAPPVPQSGTYTFVSGLTNQGSGGVLPIPYEVGLFDSSNNLLATDSGTVTTDTPQNIVATFTPVPVPTDGTVSVGLYGEFINYQGDTTTADFSNDIGSIEDPFVSDGTSASSQRTILQVTTSEIIIPESGGANPEFIQANNVALTVLGVMPVALFFALFTILSPRVDGEA